MAGEQKACRCGKIVVLSNKLGTLIWASGRFEAAASARSKNVDGERRMCANAAVFEDAASENVSDMMIPIATASHTRRAPVSATV